MHAQLAPIRVELDINSPSYERGSAPANSIELFDCEAMWRFRLSGVWHKNDDYYEAQYGLVDSGLGLRDGFAVRVNPSTAQLSVVPAGIGQVRCFVALMDKRLIISSEPLPPVTSTDFSEKGRFDNLKLSHGLDWGSPFGRGVRLRHGEIFEWCNGQSRSYYGENFYPCGQTLTTPIASEKDAISAFGLALSDATQKAMHEHEKVALHISGGIDSAAIAACASFNQRVQLKIFSWQLDEPLADESRFVRETAKKLNLELTLVRPENELGSYDPETFEEVIEPQDTNYNPFRFLVGSVLQQSALEGYHYALNGNAGDNVVALPANYALVEAWQNRNFSQFFAMLRHIIRVAGIKNLSRVQAVRYWVRSLRKDTLIDFPIGDTGEYTAELNALKALTLKWPPNLDSHNPKHAAYWKLTSGDGLFPVASALTYSYKMGCFAHTPYFDYDFVRTIASIPSYYLNYPYQFKRLSRAAFVGILPDSITRRPYRRGNLNPVMDAGYRANRARLREYLMDQRGHLPPWPWWDSLEALLQRDDNQPIRSADLAFLHKAIARIVNTKRIIEEAL